MNQLIPTGFTFLAAGSGRAAYVNDTKTIVAKVSLDSFGVFQSINESNLYKSGDKSRLARCMRVNENILLMEYLAPVFGPLPAWCLEYDNQVGVDMKGNLKAYDYGS
jgi:hypothetical protein